VLWEELRALRPKGEFTRGTLEEYEAAAEKARFSALCLSGGGIRSAAFALGVVQALAGKGLLSSFDYVSSVSGGGYLNGFLQRWIAGDDAPAPAEGPAPDPDAPKAAPAAGPSPEELVQKALGDSLAGAEAEEITRLREGANFITPRIGSMSVDTWTAVATSVRNLLVNWTLFLPLFLVVTGVPQIVYWFLFPLPGWGAPIGLALEFIGLTVAMTTVGRSLPSYRIGDDPSARAIRLGVVPPVVLAAFGTMMVLSAEPWRGWTEEERLFPAAIVFVAATLASMIVTILWSFSSKKIRRPQLLKDLWRWLICGFASAGMMYLAAKPLAGLVALTEVGVANLVWLVAFGPVAFIASILVAGWLFSAIRSIRLDTTNYKPDLDREWLVRLCAILMKPVVIWLVLVLLTLVILFYATGGETAQAGAERKLELSSYFASGGVLSGLVAALAGNSGKTAMGHVRKWLSFQTVVTIAVFLFVTLALLAGGLLESWLADGVAAYFCGARCAPGALPVVVPGVTPGVAPWSPLLGHLTVVGGLLVWVLGLGYVFHVNRFSLNGFYRNRLARAFLGAARGSQRRADPLTGFDARDNIRMHSLWPDKTGSTPERRSLFPVINIALNVSTSARLAWQERKAEPFIVTPFATGSGMLDVDQLSQPRGAYVSSLNYAGQEADRGLDDTGITLAAAMSISGAAVSPNMGYHSSATAAFLMTLFNLRLGAWLPNPVKWKDLGDKDPTARKKNALMPFLRELGGITQDTTDEVYLSDGGHFENLGLYEMIRRRCRYIFVSDGGCDPAFDFTDLGNAIRKISIDLRADIVFSEVKLGARSTPVAGRLAYAVATIIYPAAKGRPAEVGMLIYLKPSVIENLPMDVNAYSVANLAFPHESTADQWYSESQFESYRRLGQFLTERLGRHDYSVPAEGPGRVKAFFEDVWAAPAQSPAAAAETAAASDAAAAKDAGPPS
jgi:hypothetical protein